MLEIQVRDVAIEKKEEENDKNFTFHRDSARKALSDLEDLNQKYQQLLKYTE